MSIYIPTNTVRIQAFVGAVFGQAVDARTVNEVNAWVATTGNTLPGFFDALVNGAGVFGNSTNVQVSETLTSYVSEVTGWAASSEQTRQFKLWVQGCLNANPTSKGAALDRALDTFAGLQSDAFWGAGATAWVNALNAARAYVEVGTNGWVDFSTNAAGATYTLTASTTETVDGADTNDTIVGNQLTFQGTDIIYGGAGTDTLAITNTKQDNGSSPYSVTPAIMTGVENVQLTSVGTEASSIDLVVVSGVEKVISKDSTKTDTFLNVQSLAAVEIDGGSRAVTVTYDDDIVTATGAGATANVTVKGGATVSTLTVAGATDIFPTLALTSSGASANTVQAVAADYASTSDTFATVTVAGSANLTLGTSSAGLNATAINATGFTGNLTVYGATGATSITGGSGNDTVDLTLATIPGAVTAESYVGGLGDDTLVIAADLTSNTASSGTHTYSFENVLLKKTGATASVDLRADMVTGLEDVIVTTSDTTAGNTYVESVISKLSTAQTVTILNSGRADSAVNDADDGTQVVVSLADQSGAADAMTVTLNDSTVSKLTFTNDGTAANVVESVTIRSLGSSTTADNTITSLVAAGATGVTLSGTQDLVISAADLDAGSSTASTTINAAGLSGSLDLTKSEAAYLAVTLGSGATNSVRLGAVADNTSVIGGSGVDTVYVTEASGATVVDVTTNSAVEVLSLDTASGGDDTINLAGVSSATTVKVTDAAGAAGYGVTLSNVNGQTIEIVTAEAASAAANTTGDTTFASATVQAGLATGVTGASFKLSGNAYTSSSASSYGATIKTSGIATINHQLKAATGATPYYNATIDVGGISGANLTGIVLTGGGAVSTSANSVATLTNGTSTYVALTSLNASNFTGNVVADTLNWSNSVSPATVTLGDSQDITVAVAQLQRDKLAFTGGSGAGTKVTVVGLGTSAGVVDLRPSATGVETLAVEMVRSNDADSTIELRDALSVTQLNLSVDGDTSSAVAFTKDLTVKNLANNGTISLTDDGEAGTGTVTYGVSNTSSSKGLIVTSDVLSATTLNLNNAGASAAIVLAGAEASADGGLELGSSYTTLNVDLVAAKALTFGQIEGSGLTTISLENNQNTGSAVTLTVDGINASALTTLTIDSTKGAVTVSDLNTMNSLETLTVNTGVAASGGKTTITAGTAAAIDTITASGTGDFEITALTAGELDTINASGVTGAVTLGSSSAALSVASGAQFTTGEGNDAVYLSVSNLHAVNAGEKASDNDTLYIKGAMNSGAIVVDLSATGDQIATFNGAAQAAVQTGFESVDLSALTSTGSYSATITANASGSSITGTAYNDVIYGGAGADTIIAAGGTDTVTLNGGVDIVKFASLSTTQSVTVTDFTVGAGGDKLAVTTAAVATASAASAAALLTTVNLNGTDGAAAVASGFTKIADNASGLTEAYIYAKLTGGTNDLTFTGATDVIYGAIDNGTDTAIFKAVATATNATVIDQAEITIIGILSGVSDATAIVNANLVGFASA